MHYLAHLLSQLSEEFSNEELGSDMGKRIHCQAEYLPLMGTIGTRGIDLGTASFL